MAATSPLTDRETVFVREYLISLNPMDAFIKAGYSAKTARVNSSRMMTKDNIRAAIARETLVAREKSRKTLDDLIEEYIRLGFTGMSRFVKIDASGQMVLDPALCTPADIDLLSEVTIDTYMEGHGEDARQVKRIRIKPYDRFKALDKLALHLGLGVDLKDPGEDRFSLAALLKEIIARGSALPIRPQVPLLTVVPKQPPPPA